MLISQQAGRIAGSVSSPPRLSTCAHTPASFLPSRLPVPRSRCQPAPANKENEQLPATASTEASASKRLSALSDRSHRQPLAALSESDANATANNRTAAAAPSAAATNDAAEAVPAVPQASRPRRLWVKSMDVWPAMLPALLRGSPHSAASDASSASDDGPSSPEQSERRRQPGFDPTLADTPPDVKTSVIAELQACIQDMHAQHAGALAQRDASIAVLTDQLQQCRAMLDASQADAARLQQHLTASASRVQTVQMQLVESEAQRRAAQSQLTESKHRETEVKELRKQLVTISMELTRANERQVTAAAGTGEGQSSVEAVRLPVLFGDCIKRQRKATSLT